MHPHLFRRHLVTAALLGGLAVAAQAQPAPAPGTGAPQPQAQGRGFDPARMAERMNRRLADLKAKLQLAPAQEGAWTSFTTALQPSRNIARPDREALTRMTTPDRLDQMRALRTQRDAEMDRRADATKAFYAQLNAEQKKTFDAETARLFERRGGMRHHHG